MQFKLPILKSDRSYITAEHYAKFDAMFEANSCAPFIDYLEQVAENANTRIYEIVFEYAIEQGAHGFIRDLLTYDKVASRIDHMLLLQYASLYDHDFQQLALSAMAKSWHYNNIFDLMANFSFLEIFVQSAKILFGHKLDTFYRSVAIFFENTYGKQTFDKATQLIQSIFSSPYMTPEDKSFYFREWVDVFYISFKESDNKKQLIDIFLNQLPEKSEKDLINTMIYAIKGLRLLEKNDQEHSAIIIDSLLDRFTFNSEQLIQVLEGINYYGDIPSAYLVKLIARIDTGNPIYKKYELLSQLFALNSEDRIAFLMQHPEMMTAGFISENMKYFIIIRLGSSGWRNFIQQYIDNPDLEWGPSVGRYLFGIKPTDVDLIERYLTSNQVKLLDNCLEALVNCDISYRAKLMHLWLNRADCSFPESSVFRLLNQLFNELDRDSIQLILNHSQILELLQNYHSLHGDDQLRHEERETLLPKVLAWYATKPEKFEILYHSLPEDKRNDILKMPVPMFLDPNQPILRAYILQVGTPAMITEVGGFHLRFLQKAPSGKFFATLPIMWKQGRRRQTLQNYQRRQANAFAERQSTQLRFLTSSKEIEDIAKQVANVCQVKNLMLQHLTSLSNGEDVITTGYLKTKQHIQGHSISGKASGGLFSSDFLIHPKRLFTFATRIPQDSNHSGITHYSYNVKAADRANFILDGRKLLADNLHITFLVIAVYPYFESKKLLLPGGNQLISENQGNLLEYELLDAQNNWVQSVGSVQEGRLHLQIPLSANADETLIMIHQKVFELILNSLVYPLPEPLKIEVIQRITSPKSPQDHALINGLLDFIPLEWMIPGNVKLKLNYIEKIEYGETMYLLSELWRIVSQGEEMQVLEAIGAVKNIELAPFVLNDILTIALKRQQKNVVTELLKLSRKIKCDNDIIYFPLEVYEIESLVQLILENLDPEQTYVHYYGDSISIQTLLRHNTNRGGTHHAEMPKLYCALGIDTFKGKHALQVALNDTLTVSIGEGAKYCSLSAVRDALLTYEITTLLASEQNTDFFIRTGAYHPKTGKGATNGMIALMEKRLFAGEKPYQIHISYDAFNQLCLNCEIADQAQWIATTIGKILDISAEKITCDNNKGAVRINIKPRDLIAKLRQRAICYEGINVFTNDGRLLLAERNGRGLASAGGHHSNKYSLEDIAYGLQSEFGLKFKNPSNLKQQVKVLHGVKTISKTGIYVVSADALELANDVPSNVATQKIKGSFRADPDEFEPGSEVALTLAEMRGRCFYDVMPLAELCQYQLNVLMNYLKEQFPNEYQQIFLKIDTNCDIETGSQVTHKIPSPTFGQVTVIGKLPAELQNILDKISAMLAEDVTPLEIMNAIADSSSSISHKSLNNSFKR
jgi:hypothetical protein